MKDMVDLTVRLESVGREGCLGRPRLGSGWEEHFVRLMIPENSPFKRTLTTQTWSLNSVGVEIRKVDPLSKLNGKSCPGHLTLAPPPFI